MRELYYGTASGDHRLCAVCGKVGMYVPVAVLARCGQSCCGSMSGLQSLRLNFDLFYWHPSVVNVSRVCSLWDMDICADV